MSITTVVISGGITTPVIGDTTLLLRSKRSISLCTAVATARSTGTPTVPGVKSVTTTNGIVVLLFAACAMARDDWAAPNAAMPNPRRITFFIDYLGGKKMLRTCQNLNPAATPSTNAP